MSILYSDLGSFLLSYYFQYLASLQEGSHACRLDGTLSPSLVLLGVHELVIIIIILVFMNQSLLLLLFIKIEKLQIY